MLHNFLSGKSLSCFSVPPSCGSQRFSQHAHHSPSALRSGKKTLSPKHSQPDPSGTSCRPCFAARCPSAALSWLRVCTHSTPKECSEAKHCLWRHGATVVVPFCLQWQREVTEAQRLGAVRCKTSCCLHTQSQRRHGTRGRAAGKAGSPATRSAHRDPSRLPAANSPEPRSGLSGQPGPAQRSAALRQSPRPPVPVALREGAALSRPAAAAPGGRGSGASPGAGGRGSVTGAGRPVAERVAAAEEDEGRRAAVGRAVWIAAPAGKGGRPGAGHCVGPGRAGRARAAAGPGRALAAP